MNTLIRSMLIVLVWVAPALAASGSMVKGASILLILFIGFAALIIVFQFVPALVLFYSMIRGLFKAAPTKAYTPDKKK